MPGPMAAAMAAVALAFGVAADPADRRRQRLAAGAARRRLSLFGKFEASLIGQQTESLHTQGEIFAAALSEAPCSTRPTRRGAAARPGAADDAPPGRADAHPGAPLRYRRQADRRQPPAARAGRPGGRVRAAGSRPEGPPGAAGRRDIRRIAALVPTATSIRCTARATPPRLPRGVAATAARADRRCAATRRPAVSSSASPCRCSATSRCWARSWCRPATARSRKSCAPCGSNCCASLALRSW